MTDQFPIRLIIAGTRSFNDRPLLEAAVRDYLKYIHGDPSNTEIVEGGAQGADRLGHLFAEKFRYKSKRFEADWDAKGKSAGPLRNIEMARYATHCIVFWDGVSSGTKSMINEARRQKLELEIVYY